MNRFCFILLICFSIQASAADEMYFYFKGRVATIPISNYEGAHFDSSCVSHLTSCEAIKVYKGTKAAETRGKGGDRSLDYCAAIKATPFILKAKNGNEYAYCAFSDASLISAADLFQKHWGHKIIR